ncbi:hypothetical protein ACHAQF_005905 [Verticillium nonalfalfae]
MVSFLGKVSEKARLIERDLRAAATKPPTDNTEAPPAYSAEPRNDATPSAIAVDLAPALGELNLSGAAAEKLTSDACLAHLRLLFAFQVLKNEVGYTDGLWEIWDERAKGSAQVLAALREKRWALGTSRPGIAGSGYGDGQLEIRCNGCNFIVTHDSLRVTKLLKDIQNATKSGSAMPGTILDLKTGVPAMIKNDEKDEHDQLFPSRLACRGLLIEVLGMMDPKNDKIPTMLAVKDIVETYTESHRIQIELGGKAADKENDVKLNWLHLPTVEQSMLKNVTKYERFFEIMAANPGEAAVPTLDVDLAWHTHQLSPKAYYEYSVSMTRNFVDHNDKVDEEKLGVSFEWTSKTYEKKYNEVYAECRCWYCETVRMQSIPRITKMFASSKEEKFLESYHASGNSSKHPLPPSTPSAHISTHNAVHTVETKSRSATTRMQRMLFRNGIDEYEVKARKKATKPLPTGEPRMGQREDTALKWGVRVPLAGPWVSIAAATTTAAMYATPPGEVYTGPGSVGSCASGTCGGHSGCGSETLGMCSAGCVGSGWFGGGAGCTGFGGGI